MRLANKNLPLIQFSDPKNLPKITHKILCRFGNDDDRRVALSASIGALLQAMHTNEKLVNSNINTQLPNQSAWLSPAEVLESGYKAFSSLNQTTLRSVGVRVNLLFCLHYFVLVCSSCFALTSRV